MQARSSRMMKAAGMAMALLWAVASAPFASAKVKAPFQSTKLSNDLELVTLHSNKTPLVTILLSCKAGGMTESPESSGLTHLWEHMFFKGNERLPNQEAFNKRIRQLGIEYNGDTSAEKVRYYFTMPSVFIEDGLQFMSDAISTPLLDQKELEKERHVVMDEYDRNASQPLFDYYNLQRKMVYGDLAYKRDALGYRHIIEKATRQQMFDIKRDAFVPKNCALIVGGDFEETKIKGLAEKYFAGWKTPEGWKPMAMPKFQKYPNTTEFVMVRPLVENAQLRISYEGPTVKNETKDTYVADVFLSLLNHRSGKFYKKYVDSGLTYSAGLSYHTQYQAGELMIWAETKPENVEKLKKMFQEDAQAWQKPGYFSKDQLDDIKRKLLIDHKWDLNETSEFTKNLGFWWAITGLDYYASYLDNMNKVSLKDLTAFAKKYFDNKPHIDAIVLSPEGAKAANLKDTSGPLVEKYLSEYQKPKNQG